MTSNVTMSTTPLPPPTLRAPMPAPLLECSSCRNDLADADFIRALGQEWHADCFRCSACDAQLSSWYFEKDGLLFCRDDYWMKFGESCQQCGQVSAFETAFARE